MSLKMTTEINSFLTFSPFSFDQMDLQKPIKHSIQKDTNEISLFLNDEGITKEHLESRVTTLIRVGSRFLVNYAKSTSELHLKELSEKFKKKINFTDLNDESKKLPHIFKVNISDLLKLMNFHENREITNKQDVKATKYVRKIKNLLETSYQDDIGEISSF